MSSPREAYDDQRPPDESMSSRTAGGLPGANFSYTVPRYSMQVGRLPAARDRVAALRDWMSPTDVGGGLRRR